LLSENPASRLSFSRTSDVPRIGIRSCVGKATPGSSGWYRCRSSTLPARSLTGIERANVQFSSVQLGLSSCVFSPLGTPPRTVRALQVADVLPRCCPGSRITRPRPLRWARRTRKRPGRRVPFTNGIDHGWAMGRETSTRRATRGRDQEAARLWDHVHSFARPTARGIQPCNLIS
jgi:hypothetical protein